MDFTEILSSWWQPSPIAMSLFIRLLGIIYLLAFLSLMVQLKGLFGRKGILPIRDFLAMLRRLGWKRLYYVPTLFWLDSRDGFILLVCAAGALASVLLAFGVLPLIALIVMWACYLSFKSAGQDFLGFQWDALLLETGFVSIIAVASGFHQVTTILLWFTFFKFMLMAGLVKLESRDPAWRGLTAMAFHYQTQPLPNPLSWYAHNLPGWFHKASVILMLATEIGVPFLFFGPPDIRLFAFIAQSGLQLAILATGNFGALNLLTIALGVPLLDDSLLQPLSGLAIAPAPVLPFLVTVLAVLFLILLDSIQIISVFRRRAPGLSLLHAVEPFEISNRYGLFAVMTTRRFEVIPEWSHDGVEWHEYQFRWKPQGLSTAPKLSMPHMPRLDWLMWFLPFSDYESNPWFLRLLEKLLQNSPDVISLLKNGPTDPPRYVRALVYEYTFTDPQTKKKTGRWWKRVYMGEYCPPFSTLDL